MGVTLTAKLQAQSSPHTFLVAFLLALLCVFAGCSHARAQAIPLFAGAEAPAIIDAGEGDPSITIAAQLLARDLTALTGRTPQVRSNATDEPSTAIMIGLHSAPAIADVLRANNIDPGPIVGKWESYGRAVVPAPWDNQKRLLVIFGSDRRGAMYGVIDLTREMGVSAWEWWADVVIERAETITVNAALYYSREPSVRYRGVFLNDEDWGLQPWAARTFEPAVGDIGPLTYSRIFELLLRLKANMIWPAMHDSTAPFFTIEGNQETAERYAIVVGTSHAEPMLRNNVREWDSASMGPFNYFTNRERMLQYWRERAAETVQLEAIYTVGLRGVHDSGMQGARDADHARQALVDVIGEQRAILERTHGRPAGEIPQAFTAYSEVLDLYDRGLSLPDDVTIVWPDDNYGYVRRFSDENERRRSGGAGIYYHASYWGRPHDYLWLGTTHPALIHEQMERAYVFEARDLWVLNVGDIKAIEYSTQQFLDLAFDARLFELNPRQHLLRWSQTQFGSQHAGEIADVLWRYYGLAFERRPEFMGWSQTEPSTAVRFTDYIQRGDGFEARRRLAAYQKLIDDAERLGGLTPAARRDAYFQLVLYPVRAAAQLNQRILNLDLAQLYSRQGRASVNEYVARARTAHAGLVEDARRYNEEIAGGKWRGMMDIAPRRLPVFAEPAYPSIDVPPGAGCGAALERAMVPVPWETSLTFDHAAPRPRLIDIFLTRAGALTWSATPTAPWIVLSETSGGLGGRHAMETQISVSVSPDAPAGASGQITIQCGSDRLGFIRVSVLQPPPAEASFVELDGLVAINAAHADALEGGDRGWSVFQGLGHSGASLRSDLSGRSFAGNRATEMTALPHATYRFATRSTNQAVLRAFALPTHPITRENGVRIAVSIDGAPPVILDFATRGRSDVWRQNVLTNTAIAELPRLELRPGLHEMHVYPLDPGVILDRFEIVFDGAPDYYGAAPETRVRAR